MADAKKEEPTKPTPEEKLAAAEAEVDALVKKGLKALDDFEKLDQKQVDRIVAKASVAALNKHLVLASAHPSPLSAYNGFFGNKHFSKANEYLKAHGEEEIKW